MGAHVIVHDLKAQPEYNGLVGIVGETGSNERVAVTLIKSEFAANNKVISIRPDNIYCFGVFSRSRRRNLFKFLNVYMDWKYVPSVTLILVSWMN